MSKRSKQESLLLGVVAGTAVSFGIIIPIVLLAVFGGEDVGTAAQPAPATAAATQDGAINPTRGRGGPPEGRGPGSGHDAEGADPTSEGIASAEVLAAFNTGGVPPVTPSKESAPEQQQSVRISPGSAPSPATVGQGRRWSPT